ncbi:hypothetical protein JZ751_010110, partial [Albula glossodonta]
MYGAMKEDYEPEEADLPDSSYVCPKTEFSGETDSLFFNDGKRRIDFVLVYEDKNEESEKRYSIKKCKRRREYFEASLTKMGLELEGTRSVLDGKIFVKVHMPWDVLCNYAEVLHIKLPIQPNDLSSSSSTFNCFTKYFYPSQDLIPAEI